MEWERIEAERKRSWSKETGRCKEGVTGKGRGLRQKSRGRLKEGRGNEMTRKRY